MHSTINFSDIMLYDQTHPMDLTHEKDIPETEYRHNGGVINPNNPQQQGPVYNYHTLVNSPAPTANFQGIFDNGTAIPPDTYGAVGPNNLMVTLNTEVRIQTRAGAAVSTVSLDNFWASLGNPSTFDPKVVYDPYTSRWIFTTFGDGQTTSSCLLLGVSATSDPTGTWYLFKVIVDGTGVDWLDFPDIGFNKTWIVISGNLFSNLTGNFDGAKVYCFNKANVLANVNAAHTMFSSTGDFTISPVQTYSSTLDNLFLAETYDGSVGSVRLYKLHGAVGSEVMTLVGTPTATQHWGSNGGGGDFGHQSGSSCLIDCGDDRITSSVYRNGKLWFAYNAFLPASNPTRCSVEWWQMDTTGTVNQNGLIDDNTGANFYTYPSIAVSSANNALIGFTNMSSSIHPTAGYCYRLSTDAANTFENPYLYKAGLATYCKTFSGSSNRWGDYSSTQIDPVNDADFWTLQEYSGSPADNWGTWWAEVSVCVSPATPGTITGTSSVCQGSSHTYSITAVSGATSYTWTLPSGWTGTSTTTSITATAGATSGNITVVANNACGTSAASTFAVTVITVPAQPAAITGNTTVCQGSSQSYSVPSVAGATSYTWTLPSGWTGTSTTTSITATVGSSSGNITVTAVNSCGNSTVRSLAVTIVSGVPAAPGTITGNIIVCQGSSQTYSISAVSGATSYTWVLPTGWTGTSTTTSIIATVGAAGGNVRVTANNSCGSSSATTLVVTVSPVPAQPSAITGNITVCQGTSQSYSVPSVPGATSYTWTLPSGWTGTSTTTNITATVGATSGNITVTANNACGSSSVRTLAVTVLTVPAQPGAITGNTTVCQGSSQTYSVSAVAGATSYTWVLPSGWTGTSTTTSIVATAGATGGSVRVTANNICGSSSATTLVVTVSPVPAQPGTITGNTSVCVNSSQSYSVTAVSGATSYTWTLPSGWAGSSTTTSISTTVGAGSGNITVTANNTCGSSTVRTLAVTVLTVPAQPAAITGNTTVCQGTSQSYSIPAVTGATSYIWILPVGWTGNSSTTSITTTAGATSGNITVSAVNSCGSSTVRTLAVTVTALPAQPSAITGNITVCQGSSQSYSIPAVPGATSYIWLLPVGWSGNSSTTSITVVAGSTGGTISVSAINSCGSGPSRSITVTVNPTPPVPTITLVGANLVSSAATGNQWYFNTVIIPGATNQTYLPAQNGSYTVTVTNGFGCSATSAPYMLSTVGITSETLTNYIKVYPNPNTGKFTVETELLYKEKLLIRLIDLTGRIVFMDENTNVSGKFTKEINIENFPNAVYLLEIITGKDLYKIDVVKGK